MRSHLRWIRNAWRGHAGILPVLFALTLLSTGVTLAMPLVFRAVIDAAEALRLEGAGDPERQRIYGLVWVLLAVGAGRSLRNLYPMLRARMNGLIEMEIRERYFRRVLDKGHAFFAAFRTGDIVTRLTEDIHGWLKVSWYLCSGIFRAVESVAMLAGCMVAMVLFVDVRLGLIALAPLPVMMLVFYRVQVTLRRRFEKAQRMISETNDLLESAYSGIRIVKAYNAEPRIGRRLDALLSRRIEVEMDVVRLRALLDQVFTALTAVGRILAIGFGGYWIIEGTLSVGSLVAIYLYVDQLWRPMLDIPQLFVSGKQAFVCMDRLDEMAEFPAEVPDGGGEPVPSIDEIRLEDVSFRYGDSRPALDRVSVRLPKGKRLALVGPVGAGKSTLARVLSGELPPGGGRVLVNGRDLRDQNLREYRNRVGYVPQEALLFSDTVRENVSFGRGFEDLEVRDALRMAQVDEEVRAFPRGLDELLGQRGVRVSGGQRQRLAIARALIGNPDLLIMDDVTAALDAENEERLWDALDERRAGATAVVVTHRLSTARRADEILVLSDGRVVDRGTHEELLRRCALYRRLASE